jgi:hypothetical protein
MKKFLRQLPQIVHTIIAAQRRDMRARQFYHRTNCAQILNYLNT